MPDETLASDFSSIPAEITEDGYVSADGENYVTEDGFAVLESESESDADLTTSVLESDIEVLANENVFPVSDPVLLSASYLPDSGNVYHLSISGQEYSLFVPEDIETLMVLDGSIVNMGSSSVTGLLVANDGAVNVYSWQERFLTIQPLLTSSANNNAYRYGSRCYITTYSVGSGSSLTSTTTYVVPSVTSEPKPGHNFDSFQLFVCGALLLSLLFSLIGGIIRTR